MCYSLSSLPHRVTNNIRSWARAMYNMPRYCRRLLSRGTRMSDKSNIISFPIHRVERTKEPVPTVCEIAGEVFKDLIIMGENHEGAIQMITTVSDPAEILWYMEAARFGIMAGSVEDE